MRLSVMRSEPRKNGPPGMPNLIAPRRAVSGLPLEPPLSNQERPEDAGRSDTLIARERRLLKQVARLHARLHAVALQTAEAVHELDTRPLERRRIERRLNREEGVRPDVLAELELGAAEKAADVGLNVGRGNGENIRSQ